jgi:V/A-type H+-transporting ATPase subunit E
MDAQQVIEKILADANAEAEKIKKEADEKQAVEQKQFDEQLNKYKEETQVLAKKAAEDKKAHLLAAGRMDVAKEYLAEKRKIMDQIFQQAQKQLLNLPDEEYRALMTKLILDAVETGDEEVIIDSQETRIDQNFIKEINRKLGPGYHGSLRLAGEKQNIGGGFILKRGKIKNNTSLSVLLNQAQNELEIELAKKLFEEIKT